MADYHKHTNMYAYNRARLAEMLPDSSAAVVFANPFVICNADALYPYRPEANLVWLTGIAQEKTTFLLWKKDDVLREYLFIARPNRQREIWDGRMLSADQAREISGVDQVLFTEDFWDFLPPHLHQVESIYVYSNENDRRPLSAVCVDSAGNEQLRQYFPVHQYCRLAPVMKALRMIKSAAEIQRIRAAIEVTRQAFLEILKNIKTTQRESDIHACIHANFVRHQAREGFESIVASGDNARILHYNQNDALIEKDSLILIDFGARKHFYTADVSRTIPISGAFSPRQKQLYDGCWELQTFAKSLLKPGLMMAEYMEHVGNKATDIFLRLGLLSPSDVKNQDKQNPAWRKYCCHGISHHLGVDVHDLGDYSIPVQEGMVLTVEPGIYVEEERVGIRLENDIQVGKNGPIDLCESIPIATQDIEELMRV